MLRGLMNRGRRVLDRVTNSYISFACVRCIILMMRLTNSVRCFSRDSENRLNSRLAPPSAQTRYLV